MDESIFITKPEFIDLDIRKNRPKISGGNINADNTFIKHSLLLPKSELTGKRILDLGSCNAASGAWVLNYGASFYKGVELLPNLAKRSRILLKKYYSPLKWNIENLEIEQFLKDNDTSYDITIIAEILHALSDPISVLREITKISKVIVIESTHPSILQKTNFLNEELKMQILNSPDYENYIENEPFMGFGIEGMTLPDEQTLLFKSLKPSLGLLKSFMRNEGYIYNDFANKHLKELLPNIYSKYNKYAAIFIKKEDVPKKNYGFNAALEGTTKSKIYKWRKY